MTNSIQYTIFPTSIFACLSQVQELHEINLHTWKPFHTHVVDESQQNFTAARDLFFFAKNIALAWW